MLCQDQKMNSWKAQVEELKTFQKDFVKLKEDSRSRRGHWAEGYSRRNQNKGKALYGKLSEERWSLFVDGEEKSSWKSYQVKRAYQVCFLQRFRVNLIRRLGLANENSFKNVALIKAED